MGPAPATLGHMLATAHDMGQERRIIWALAPTDVPVAPVVGLFTDEDVNGTPFHVMGFVDGLVVRDRASAEQLDIHQRRNASRRLAEVLASIHAVDPDAVGLGELGRREGYIERQLRRWYGPWPESSKTRDLDVVDEVHDALAARVPEQGGATMVHGDYRLDNCLLEPDGTIAAVLDSELCTLGDPLADVGLLLVYWTEPGDAHPALFDAATAAEGFVTHAELMDLYSAASGRDVSHVDYLAVRLRLLEAGLHPRRRLRPATGRGDGLGLGLRGLRPPGGAAGRGRPRRPRAAGLGGAKRPRPCRCTS